MNKCKNCTLSIADRTQDGIEIFYSRILVVFSSQAGWEQEDQVKQTYPCIYHFLAEESRDLPIASSVPNKLFEHATKRIDIS